MIVREEKQQDKGLDSAHETERILNEEFDVNSSYSKIAFGARIFTKKYIMGGWGRERGEVCVGGVLFGNVMAKCHLPELSSHFAGTSSLRRHSSSVCSL